MTDDDDLTYRCACTWVGGDPDIVRGRPTCPACWHHDRKRVEVSVMPDEPLPACVLGMGCYCACHAAGLIATDPCDTDETRARKIATSRHRVRQRLPRTTDG